MPDGFLDLPNPPALPEILDMLIVGGGPAGTAAAFRAKELGLSALVIDFDDLMKRIRDYAKDKLILPHFGGGDKMRFPAGNEMVAALQFDPIDKDDICTAWRSYYHKFNVPAKIGLELTGFTRESDNIIAVQVWNHRLQKEENIRARHVVLSIGRGVPRRFDIPGNTDGISYRLEDANLYVGQPACVIGGGTSAAEAVFAISNAKTKARDQSPVYWSYRGDKMPKVSRALSEAFFNAYLGNGNIRYFPKSEPVAILPGPDKAQFLSIRVDRRHIEGRSIEATHLEFPKSSCIACIGEDIPAHFLEGLGIRLAKQGKKQRMLVSPLLETSQPNVYLIGDILSQRYFETDNFDGNPEAYREIRHPGNIKSALRDGVFVAEVVRQKKDGVSQVKVALGYADSTVRHDISSAQVQLSTSFIRQDTSELVSANQDVETGVSTANHSRLVRLTKAGVEAEEYTLDHSKRLSIGSVNADVVLAGESSLGDKHAGVYFENGTCFLEDYGSPQGSFYRLPAGNLVEVADGALVQLGRQFLVFGVGPGRVTCQHYDHHGVNQNTYILESGTKVFGRESPDFTLDASDKILSRRHLAVSFKEDRLYLKDLSSRNHTYLRIQSAYPIHYGDVFRLGQVVFQYAKSSPYKPDVVAVDLPARTPEPPSSKSAPASMAVDTGVSVTFAGHGEAVPTTAEKTVLQLAREQSVPINYECESGRCGYDPVRIVSGQEHVNEMDEDEEGWTLQEVCKLNPGEHRLACLLKANGPVVVEVVKK